MAERDDRTYKIIVPLPGDKKSAMASSGSSSAKKTQDDKTAQGAINAVKGIVGYSAVRSYADKLISYDLSQVNLRTGAAEYQQKLQFVYSEGARLFDSVVSIATGAAAGGLVGEGIAAIGVGVSYLMKTIGWSQNAQRLETEQNLESISLKFASISAGVSGRRSSSQ